MSRRHAAIKRVINPDAKYKSVLLAKFINNVMRDGKKSIAEKLVYGALERVEKKHGADPFKTFTESMNNVLSRKLAEIGLTMNDIKTNIKSRSQDSSHFGNWCYLPVLDIPQLHKTDMLLDLPQVFLEVSDLKEFNTGDRVEYSIGGIFGNSVYTGRIFKIQIDEYQDLGIITVSKGKSKVKGYRFYTGDNIEIRKI